MKYIDTKIIEEVEYLKDLLWYLRGYVKSKNEDMEYSEIGIKHVNALRDVIIYIQEKIPTKN